ncbi:MAG: hypothetical protein JXA21_20265 [Anaerolineae bacterium]|nr:hypothetical protein [Anaerolineae bacterium]
MNSRWFRLVGKISILLMLVMLLVSQSYAQSSPGRLATNYTCAKFSFSDANGVAKRVFKPGDTIRVTYTDAAKPYSVEVYYTDLSDAAPNWGASPVMNWTKVGGSYNNSTGQFVGTININTAGLNKNTEILVVANVKATSTSNICSGNPIYPGCPNGVWVGGGSPATPAACNGCQSLVAVDVTSSSYTEDTRNYWKLDPGNNWTYTGLNTTYNVNGAYQSFTSRIEIENSVTMCGRSATPMRFTKSNMYGYWGARYSWHAANDPWTGDYSRRFFATGFLSDSYWNGTEFMGSLGGKSYTLPGGQNNFMTLGSFYPYNQVYFPSSQQNFYFPSYFLSPRLVNPSAVYQFERNDRIFRPYRSGITTDNYCGSVPSGWDTKYPSSGYEKDHGWHLDIKPTTISVFGQSVQALRYRWIEYQVPMGSGFILREDWYVAKNIGLVKLDGKDISHYLPNLTWAQCQSEPMCLGKDFLDTPTRPSSDAGKVLPDVTMSVSNAYLGGTLTANNSLNGVNWGSSITLQYGVNQTWYLRLSGNYTGWVDVYSSYNGGAWTITEKWGWANNGVIVRTKAASVARGTYLARYRPHTLELSDISPLPGNESQLSIVEKPWSNQITNIVQ